MSQLSAVTVGGQVDGVLWDARVRAGEPVGTCACGGDLRGSTPRIWRGLRWYEAECATCGWEVTSPGGKLGIKRAVELEAV